MAQIFLLFILSITVTATSLIWDLQSVIDLKTDRRHVAAVSDTARVATLFYSLRNRYPSTKQELQDFARSIGEKLSHAEIQYVYVPVVVGAQYQYPRAIIYLQNPRRIVDDSDFQALNLCGTGLDDDDGYCAPNEARYTVLDASGLIQNQLRTMNFRMNETFFKLTQSYDGRNGGFPRVKNDGTTMPLDSSVTLANFVGYAGTAVACSGTFRFSTMPLNCSDLFDDYGNPVTYYYKNGREVSLLVKTSFKDGAGNQINISRYVKV